MSQSEISVLQDVLRVYDQRFLELGAERRRRLVSGTREVLGDEGLPAGARAALPAAYRLRAFCIQNGLYDELERLIREETAGERAGAVVVGGRVYAMYPYLRGVPRLDADITDEVGVDHRLDAFAWSGERLRVRGHAAIAHVEARSPSVTLVLHGPGDPVSFPAEPAEDGFQAHLDPAALGPGVWTTHVRVEALGLSREAPFGGVHDPRLSSVTRTRAGISASLSPTLTLDVPAGPPRRTLLHRLLRH